MHQSRTMVDSADRCARRSTQFPAPSCDRESDRYSPENCDLHAWRYLWGSFEQSCPIEFTVVSRMELSEAGTQGSIVTCLGAGISTFSMAIPSLNPSESGAKSTFSPFSQKLPKFPIFPNRLRILFCPCPSRPIGFSRVVRSTAGESNQRTMR